MRRARSTPTSAARKTLAVVVCLAALLQQTWTAAHLAQHTHLHQGRDADVRATTQHAQAHALAHADGTTHGHGHGADRGAHPSHGSDHPARPPRGAHHHASGPGSADTPVPTDAPRTGSAVALATPPGHGDDHLPHDEAEHGARYTAPGGPTLTGGTIDRAAASVRVPRAPAAPRLVAIHPSECWPRPPPERSCAPPRAPPPAA